MSKAAANVEDILNSRLISILEANPNDQSYYAIEKCLKEGADANTENFSGFTALELAFRNGHNDLIISLLIDFKANPSIYSAYNNVLFYAIKKGYSVSTIKKLIDKGADPHNIDFFKSFSGLDTALDEKNLAVAKCLIECGVNITYSVGAGLLTLALIQRDFETAGYLIGKGVSGENVFIEKFIYDAVKNEDLKLIKFGFEECLIGKIVNDNGVGHKLLALALLQKNLEIAGYLIGNGVSGEKGICHELLALALLQKNLEIAEYLIEKGVIDKGRTSDKPIYAAFKTGDIEILKFVFQKYLIKKNDNVKAIGHKLLSQALKQKNLEVVKCLIDEGAYINGEGQNKPIYAACETGDLKIVEFLLQYKPDLTSTIGKCLRYGFNNIAEYLAENGAPWVTESFEDFSWLTNMLGFNIVKSASDSKTYNIKICDYKLRITNKALSEQELIQKVISESTLKDTIKVFNLIKIKHYYTNGKFILTTQTSGFERGAEGKNLKVRSGTIIKDSKLYWEKTDELIKDTLNRYIVDEKGDLFVMPPDYNNRQTKHSFILRGIEGKTKLGDISLYGYGKPVASAGYVTILDGKIVCIDNSSGHYRTEEGQFKIACNHLYHLGILTKNASFKLHDEIKQTYLPIDLDFETLNIGEILDNYSSL